MLIINVFFLLLFGVTQCWPLRTVSDEDICSFIKEGGVQGIPTAIDTFSSRRIRGIEFLKLVELGFTKNDFEQIRYPIIPLIKNGMLRTAIEVRLYWSSIRLAYAPGLRVRGPLMEKVLEVFRKFCVNSRDIKKNSYAQLWQCVESLNDFEAGILGINRKRFEYFRHVGDSQEDLIAKLYANHISLELLLSAFTRQDLIEAGVRSPIYPSYRSYKAYQEHLWQVYYPGSQEIYYPGSQEIYYWEE